MNNLLRLLCLLLASASLTLSPHASAQTTIDPTLSYAWSANLGWTNWRPSSGQGASIGEYVCSGYVYGGNVGWINLGNGAPANGIQYQNNSGADWGVNYSPGAAPGVATLRGYAYGANIGWINFEAVGNPSVNMSTGQLYGYAYSANCGWINLGNSTTYVVKTNSIAPGADTNGNGIADAWELIHFGNLTTATAVSDSDGDGVSDLREYLEGSDPRNAADNLRITQLGNVGTSGSVLLNMTFTTTAARIYRIEMSGSLASPNWTDAGLGVFLPDSTPTTTRQVTGTGATQFFRVRALQQGF